MNARLLRGVCSICAIFCSIAPVFAQNRVQPQNMYERVLAVVPWAGSGTPGDPKRPMYTPAATPTSLPSRNGILGFQCVSSDDGKHALCEFVAKDRNALKPILNDPTVKSFLKGRDKAADVALEFKKHKKDFDFSQFGVRVP